MTDILYFCPTCFSLGPPVLQQPRRILLEKVQDIFLLIRVDVVVLRLPFLLFQDYHILSKIISDSPCDISNYILNSMTLILYHIRVKYIKPEEGLFTRCSNVLREILRLSTLLAFQALFFHRLPQTLFFHRLSSHFLQLEQRTRSLKLLAF